jgi:hypothetical protein
VSAIVRRDRYAVGFATADVPRAGSSADVRVQLVGHGGACTSPLHSGHAINSTSWALGAGLV